MLLGVEGGTQFWAQEGGAESSQGKEVMLLVEVAPGERSNGGCESGHVRK